VSGTLRYAVVSPARDEAENLRRLARCLFIQSAPPAAWIIVDNGSADDTRAVADELARQRAWVSVASVPDAGGLARGAPVVRAFHAGVDQLLDDVDLVAKVDADISFGREYFAQLVRRFEQEPELGIASGTCLERQESEWNPRFATEPNVWGGARLYRKVCLDTLLPLDERMGWDAIDVARAAAAGWTTRVFLDIQFRHHRTEAERDGLRRARWVKQGELAYFLHYRPSYLLLRALHHGRREPAALAMVWAYLEAALRRGERCVDRDVVVHLRQKQRLRNLPHRAAEALGRNGRSALA
jgi:poly-beta-1,6-N-acetyl-D-glucosamine synthase